MATVRIPCALYEQIVHHARENWPEEACGLLAGHIEQAPAPLPVPAAEPKLAETPDWLRVPAYGQSDALVKVVEAVFPVENVDHSREHFTIDPRDQLHVVKQARSQGLALLGNFHSHPDTPARPSDEDKRLSNDVAASYLILSLAGEAPQLNAFHIEGDAAWREPIEII